MHSKKKKKNENYKQEEISSNLDEREYTCQSEKEAPNLEKIQTDTRWEGLRCLCKDKEPGKMAMAHMKCRERPQENHRKEHKGKP